MSRVLIVAYGNPLRSDDGIAWRAADSLDKKFPPSEVEILRVHQLAPELAENASRSDSVIFIDAASVPSSLPGEIRAEEVCPTLCAGPSRFSHVQTPQDVIALAERLYAARPKSFIVTVAGASFDHGESLSPSAEAALPILIERIVGIVRTFLQQKA